MKRSAIISILLATLTCVVLPLKSQNTSRSDFSDINPEGKEGAVMTEAQIDSLEMAAYGDVHDLKEIVVTANAPMIKVSGNQITYNVDEDPAAGGSSVLDLLRKVPLISVDGGDNIRVKGNGDYKIYVNGHPEPMLSQNASVILKAMPAEAIGSIELITDPGAKFDAEGSGAIINLITEKKQTSTGYNGSANLSVDNRQIQAGINGVAKFNRLSLNAGINYAHSFNGSQKAKIHDETLYLNNPVQHLLRGSGINSQNIDFIGVDLGGSYDLSSSDLITFYANYYNVSGNMRNYDQRTEMFSTDNILQWGYSRNSNHHLVYRGVTAQTSYQHEFGRQNNYIGISYMFNFSKAGLPGDYTYGELEGYDPGYIYEHSENDRISREHTIQIDWADTFNQHSKLEIGGKGVFRRNSAFGQNEGSNDLVSFQPIEGSIVNMHQPQDIYALYSQYTATYGKVTAQAGVRYEHTRMGIKYPLDAEKDFSSNLNDVVPNLSLTYAFSPANTLSANYSMRISRPSIEQLNPYKLNISDTRIQQGNPYLKSERINKVNVTYTNFSGNLGGTITADYTDSDNAIASYSFIDGYQIVNSYANIGRNRIASLNLFLLWSPVKSLRFTLNAAGIYTDKKAEMDFSGMKLANHGFTGNLNLNAEWTLPQKFLLGAFGGWNSGSVELMGKGGDYHYYGVTLSKSFLKDDSLKLTFNAFNCFEKYITYSSKTTSPDFITSNSWQAPAWRVGVSVSWKFGKNDANVKRVNSAIVNDDISTVESSTKTK